MTSQITFDFVPFCRFRKSKLKLEPLLRITEKVDIIEIFNSRNTLNADNKKAYEFAKKHNKLMAVGSDAHLAYEYGNSFVRMHSFKTCEEFKRSLISANFMMRKSPLWVHLVTKWMKIYRKPQSSFYAEKEYEVLTKYKV